MNLMTKKVQGCLECWDNSTYFLMLACVFLPQVQVERDKSMSVRDFACFICTLKWVRRIQELVPWWLGSVGGDFVTLRVGWKWKTICVLCWSKTCKGLSFGGFSGVRCTWSWMTNVIRDSLKQAQARGAIIWICHVGCLQVKSLTCTQMERRRVTSVLFVAFIQLRSPYTRHLSDREQGRCILGFIRIVVSEKSICNLCFSNTERV